MSHQEMTFEIAIFDRLNLYFITEKHPTMIEQQFFEMYFWFVQGQLKFLNKSTYLDYEKYKNE